MHPALELVAHVYGRLTPGQQRTVHRRLHETMRAQGIGPARMAERLRHWRLESPRDPMAWLLYAIKTPPHGCQRDDCENGVLWDPGADMPIDACSGCAERMHARAVARRLPDGPAPQWPPPRDPLRLVDCDWCETPMCDPPPGAFLCKGCRTGVPA